MNNKKNEEFSCPICKKGELKKVSKNRSRKFGYLICDNCYITYYDNKWLKPERNIVGLFYDNTPIFLV